MFIYYMVNPERVFSPQAQALDLCLRVTACPIFSLPPPPALLKYFHEKYGSSVRDDNPNAMLEEGITNNLRPWRPPLLVSQPTNYNSRRGSAFDLSYPSYHERRNFDMRPSFSDLDEVRCKRYMDEDAHIGTTSSLDTATETSPKLKSVSINSSSLRKEAQTPTIVAGDDSILTSVSITIPPLDAHSACSTHETTRPSSPPPAFAQGVTLGRHEDEETAIAARKISRRFTMEGRKDGLDFLGIGGLIKWPHRPSSSTPALKVTLSGSFGNNSFNPLPPLPAIVSGPSLVSSRSRSETRDRSISPSGTRGDKQSRISDYYIEEEDETTETASWRDGHDGYSGDNALSHNNDHAQQESEKVEERWDRTTQADMKHTDLSDIRTDTLSAQDHVRSRASNATLNDHDEGLHQSRSRRLSMDDVRQLSRHALTRLQVGTALNIPPPTGPLSLTILRKTHGSNISDESRLNSLKSSSSSGDVALEQTPTHPLSAGTPN